MMIVVSGGSGSGKSAFAENLAVQRHPSPLQYIATMQVWDAECEARVARHREMRAGKGFATVECPSGLDTLTLPTPCSVLLEDLPNLVANEFFSDQPRETASERIYRGLDHIYRQCDLLVVVTNELFSDGLRYDEETNAYLALLAQINRGLAALSTEVYEVVAGLPICHKGGQAD
ncbi:bifunctional adenosylcobinamide kinase/adenosylcobinamide-phosphate guanylyltransferase [Bengtsoniella intestinalis]|uniref:bifunctional adenosylcobinamide kinase/adenosylcobinamide-phosphate guanylyltransferase n=1 Tax=Bengtsoniella intestinalis TaxID=3073143 RepID=UPI00391F4D05